jgi:hypothetical protein
MRAGVAALITSVLAGAPAFAHHSFAVFDTQHPLELAGTVHDFRFTSPHAIILLEVKSADGQITVWSLEGASPNLLMRDGWTRDSLKSGDEIRLTIDPLRSGAPGGAWISQRVEFRSGRPVACCPPDGL